MEKIWHYFTNGTHPISIFSLIGSLVALAVTIINSRRGHFDLMVKKLDLVSPVYESSSFRINKNEAEFNKVLNLTRQSFVHALSPNHMYQSQGDYQLRTFGHSEKQYEVWIDPKLPDGAQIRIRQINENLQSGMSALIDATHFYQSGFMTPTEYLERNRIWTENSQELGKLILDFSQFSQIDLQELTTGIRKRSKLSKASRLKLQK